MTNPPWRTPVIVELARQSMEQGSRDLSLILADALEEAGGPTYLITHLRHTGHMPGICQLLRGLLNERHDWSRCP